MTPRMLALLCALLLAPSSPVAAHKLAPSLLSLEQAADGLVEVVWRTPRIVARGTRLLPRLPAGCTPDGVPTQDATDTAFVERSRYRCPVQLAGLELGVDGLAGSGTNVLVRVRLADGGESQALLGRDRVRFEIPASAAAPEVAGSYLRMGAEHLITGWDHLLFVAGLVLLVGASRSLAVAITAFTLGHSVTLALAVLGFVVIPQALTEIAIAASLVVLARELLRASAEPGATPSLLARRPGLLCFGFGLVHGLGFAGALAELGVPAHAIPLSLVAFNLGIELGQLAVVALWLPLSIVLGRFVQDPPRWLAEAPATLIGALGVAWCLERASSWLGVV